jgi:C-terminal processing protease CtpA/Prc
MMGKPDKEHSVNISKPLFKSFVLVSLVALSVAPAWPQLSALGHQRVEDILDGVASDLHKNYYDPKFHGIDLDAKVAETKARLAKATSWEAAMLEIAVLVDDFNDSHTVFVPARPPESVDYGWRFQMIGGGCYVTHVRPHSDAEAKGIKPGERVVTLDEIKPTRASFPKIEYATKVLSPQASLRVTLIDTAGSTRSVDVPSNVKRPRLVNGMDHPYEIDQQFYRLGFEDEVHRMKVRYAELGSEAMILKLPEFFLSWSELDKIASKARKHAALIIDLRDNPGGSVETLQYLLGSMFDHEVKIADTVMRTKTTPLTTKRHHDSFNGKLIVLVDGSSSSASELFARTIQIEKRGTILGDRTSGLVMEAKLHLHEAGLPPVYFAEMITESDLIMTDGKSLERNGVMPDEMMLPTPSDLADGSDRVLARAAELAGAKLTPEDAGKLFPYIWPEF